MASPSPENDNTSMFMIRRDSRGGSPRLSEPGSTIKTTAPAEIITVKDFFDFMKTAYQVYEHLEGDDDEGTKINWEELTKLTVINHVIEQQERDLLFQTAYNEPKPITSKSDTALEKKTSESKRIEKRLSCSEIEGETLKFTCVMK
ncbi:hypothetical protein MSG28_005528 [Choristoneura fumiferana]|uniref:Uncharacterized protein n=1 Tax=Choristoneura fumiferana TaxID=7141 RepID=A0ACC0KZ70_CHOFU|nr:hypothetical protein MSG28_005528 [Choristoneura fumiferana]